MLFKHFKWECTHKANVWNNDIGFLLGLNLIIICNTMTVCNWIIFWAINSYIPGKAVIFKPAKY